MTTKKWNRDETTPASKLTLEPGKHSRLAEASGAALQPQTLSIYLRPVTAWKKWVRTQRGAQEYKNFARRGDDTSRQAYLGARQLFTLAQAACAALQPQTLLIHTRPPTASNKQVRMQRGAQNNNNIAQRGDDISKRAYLGARQILTRTEASCAALQPQTLLIHTRQV